MIHDVKRKAAVIQKASNTRQGTVAARRWNWVKLGRPDGAHALPLQGARLSACVAHSGTSMQGNGPPNPGK